MQQVELKGVSPRQQYAFYPFSTSTYDHIESKIDYRTGMDIFWRPSSNLQLTATLRPDFGTVESDNVVVNLTAFETFFREKRMFFLEGNEIFLTTPRSNPHGDNSSYSTGARKTYSSFSPSPTTLVNTRRIGSPPLTPTIPDGVTVPDVEMFQLSELYGAVKVTGQKGRLRYGLMSAFEEDTRIHGQSDLGEHVLVQTGRDFGILRLSYEDTSQGQRGLGWMTTAVLHDSRDAIVHGVDAHYISPSTRWRADLQLMYSDIQDVVEGDTNGYGGLIDLVYKPRQGTRHTLKFDYLDEDIEINDLGFARRNDVIGLSYAWEKLNTELEKVRAWKNSWQLSQEYNQQGRVVRSGVFWRNDITLNNSWLVRTELDYFPARWDDRNSNGYGDFRIKNRWVAEAGIGTPTSKKLAVSIAAGVMQEHLGDWTSVIKGGFTYKPVDRLTIDLGLLYQRRDGWLLHQAGRTMATYDSINWHPKLSMEYSITARQEVRLTMQWAGIRAREQGLWDIPSGDGSLIGTARDTGTLAGDFGISQLSTQLRYRWEIAPLSDLFIVYTRGSRLVSTGDDDFEDFFKQSLTEPQVNYLVVKLRYRFGT
ncbi:MAG: hypothetical protein HN816_08815 [Gammaproteobacteria bacterium]|nr:hypothetical protein [Gammaproteobacteria bacterium]